MDRSKEGIDARMANRLHLGLAALAALTLAACTTGPPLQRAGGPAPLEGRAQQAVEDGDFRAALGYYRRLADAAEGELRAGYLIDGAAAALALDDTVLAADWLREADRYAADAQRARIIVQRAQIDVIESRPANAIARLNQLAEPMPMPVLTEAQRVRGNALFALGRTADAVRVLVERETWLETSEAILENQRLIWEGLSAPAAAAAQPTGDEVVDGWLALAPIAASGAAGPELRGALVDWRRNHAGHPAGRVLLSDLLAVGRAEGAYPGQIALLLPISSEQSAAAAAAVAIRDGFLAAHLAARRDEAGREISIRIYDTALLGAREAYRRAQLEGAEFIVGPLLRPAVESIIEQAGFVPTLALNFIDADTSFTTGFWQFALAPEDETRAIAQRAFGLGARTAVALVPSNDWGYRLLNSFREEFEALGGEVLEFNGYAPDGQDFSGPIEQLMNLDVSRQRRTRLAANLGVNLAFEPRRRRDADMIFLAAPTRGVGRLLAPALRFHFAGDIPTYATSAIHEPADSARDGDLNGIFFTEAPWVLEPEADEASLRRTVERFWPQRASSGNLRLYGMGIDAYRLVGALSGDERRWPIDGLSGALRLDAAGRIHRLMPLAQFRDGRPVTVEPVGAVAGRARGTEIVGGL